MCYMPPDRDDIRLLTSFTPIMISSYNNICCNMLTCALSKINVPRTCLKPMRTHLRMTTYS